MTIAPEQLKPIVKALQRAASDLEVPYQFDEVAAWLKLGKVTGKQAKALVARMEEGAEEIEDARKSIAEQCRKLEALVASPAADVFAAVGGAK